MRARQFKHAIESSTTTAKVQPISIRTTYAMSGSRHESGVARHLQACSLGRGLHSLSLRVLDELVFKALVATTEECLEFGSMVNREPII